MASVRILIRQLLPFPLVLVFIYPTTVVAQAQLLLQQENSGSSVATADGTKLFAGELSAAERAHMLARLNDTEVRALLLQFLESAAAASQAPAADSMLSGFEAEADQMRNKLIGILQSWPELPGALAFAVKQLIPPGWDASFYPLFLLALGGFLLSGFIAEWFFLRVIGDIRQQVEQSETESLGGKCGRLGILAAIDVLGIAIFGLAAIGAFFVFYQGHSPVRLTVLTYIEAVIVFRIVVFASRCLLAPGNSALRMLPFGDDAASVLHRCILWIGVFGAFGILTGGLVERLDAAIAPAQLFKGTSKNSPFSGVVDLESG